MRKACIPRKGSVCVYDIRNLGAYGGVEECAKRGTGDTLRFTQP